MYVCVCIYLKILISLPSVFIFVGLFALTFILFLTFGYCPKV